MSQIGLKLWSTNTDCIDEASRLCSDGVFDYIELYVVPKSAESCLNKWKNLRVPYILHAPHSYSGLNLSLRDFEQNNRLLIEEVELFRIALNPRRIIFHPGIDGALDETIRQLLLFKELFPNLFDKALIENKPKIGLNGEFCLGASPAEIREIISKMGIGFCLDVGHAFCYSAWAKTDADKVLDDFIELNPYMFHISDGMKNSCTDLHLNFGCGDFDIKGIVEKIPSDKLITIETKKEDNFDVDLPKKEAVILRGFFGKCKYRILFLGGNNSQDLVNWLQDEGEEITYSTDKVTLDDLKQIKPTMIISYNYKHILEKKILDYVHGMAINLHISFLPWNKGAYPNLWSFVDDTPKGVTIHYMDKGMDTGDIIIQKEVFIDENKETLKSSYEILHKEIQKLFKENWLKIKKCELGRQSQMVGGGHFSKESVIFEQLIKEKGWDTPVKEFKNQYCEWRNKVQRFGDQ